MTVAPVAPVANADNADNGDRKDGASKDGGSKNGDAPADCSEDAFNKAFGASNNGWYHAGCEGDFVLLAPNGSDAFGLAQWDGATWVRVDGDEVVTPDLGMPFECYNASTVERLGIGPKVRAQLFNCATEEYFDSSRGNDSDSGTGSAEKQQAADDGYSYDRIKNSDGHFVSVGLGEAATDASFPACDGRYILIVNSVIDKGNDQETFSQLAEAVMLAGPPGAEFTVPGQCDSLRKSVHGNDIYPVYLDFGSDKAAACRAKATYGGNVRPLVNGLFPDASAADVDEARLALDPC